MVWAFCRQKVAELRRFREDRRIQAGFSLRHHPAITYNQAVIGDRPKGEGECA